MRMPSVADTAIAMSRRGLRVSGDSGASTTSDRATEPTVTNTNSRMETNHSYGHACSAIGVVMASLSTTSRGAAAIQTIKLATFVWW